MAESLRTHTWHWVEAKILWHRSTNVLIIIIGIGNCAAYVLNIGLSNLIVIDDD